MEEKLTKQDFIEKLEELTEAESGTFTEKTVLGETARWDSLIIVGFMAMVDETMGFAPSPKDIAKCKTVGDLLKIVSSGIKGE
jgi:acyl carrier protein